MIDIFKIVGIGIVGGVISLFLKSYRKEFAVLSAAATGIIILFISVDMISEIAHEFFLLSEKVGIADEYIEIVLKTIGIAYIVEFAVQVLNDAEEKSIASKVELVGKLCILYLTFPIIVDFLEVCINAVNSI